MYWLSNSNFEACQSPICNHRHLALSSEWWIWLTAWLKTASRLCWSWRRCTVLHAASWSNTKLIECLALSVTSITHSFRVWTRTASWSCKSAAVEEHGHKTDVCNSLRAVVWLEGVTFTHLAVRCFIQSNLQCIQSTFSLGIQPTNVVLLTQCYRNTYKK